MLRSSIYFSKEQAKRLQAIAHEFGCLQSRGVGAGKIGSISLLIRSIADGKIKLVKSDKENSA